ncbi:MAG TPA: NusG domain II-containing protein [Spirochaetota bacterium]|nr:NusG domain II-containing protein [Spirochaetota bacterium]
MKTNKRFKIGDFVIIAAVVIFILFFFYRNVLSKPAGRRVEITAQAYENSFFLDEDRVVEVEGPLGITEVLISDGEAWVRSSPCREKICIKMGRIKRVSEQVVCIPNRVVVEVVGENGRVDGVTR